MNLIITTVALLALPLVSCKICWKSCKEDLPQLKSVDISGCRRRSTYPKHEDFWCEGDRGPPCTATVGDTLSINMELENQGVTNLTHSAVYMMTSFIEVL